LLIVNVASDAVIRENPSANPWMQNRMLSVTGIERRTIVLDGRSARSCSRLPSLAGSS